MKLKGALSLQTVTTELEGVTKEEVILSLVDLCCTTGKVKDRGKAVQSVLERERHMSTGMQQGVALPHGKTEAVGEMVASVGVTPEPVDFQAMDGKPCRIFVMTLSPPDRSGPHFQFLAEITKLLNDSATREELLAARNPAELLSALIT